MANVLVRNIPTKMHRDLRLRARKNGSSVNAEILSAIGKATEPEEQVGLGTQLQEWKKKYLGDDTDWTFEVIRDKTPAGLVDFSGPEFDLADSE
jgi:plasmid stability protein